MVPALTEGDVRSDLQKHTAKTLFTSKEQGSYTAKRIECSHRPLESVERLSSMRKK